MKKLILLILCIPFIMQAQTTTNFGPDGFVKMDSKSIGFFANLNMVDRYCKEHDAIGDRNGDGIIDLAVDTKVR